MDDKNNNYQLSFFGALTMATGFTIGSGIITQTGIGIGMTGRSIFLAFLASAVLFLISFRPLFIMSSVLPKTSAAYFYSKNLIGDSVRGLYTYVYFLGRITIAIFGISFAQYLSSLIPALSSPIIQRIIACLILTLFFIINLCGMKTASKFQNIMFFILLSGLFCFIISGLPKVSPDFLTAEILFSGGFGGFYSAVSLLFFAVGGAYIMTDFAPSVKDSSRVVIKIIYIVTLGVCAIYMLLGIVASGVVPSAEAAYMPLTVAANAVFSNKALFSFFIVGACIGALLTTLNSSFVWYSNSLINACNEGWLPAKWGKKNKNGVPVALMTIFYLFGLVPTILGIDLTLLSKSAIGLTILAICIPMLGVINLPKKYPQQWQASKYSKRYPKWRLICMCIFTYLVMGTQVAALFAGNPPMANVVIIACLVLIISYILIRKRVRQNKSLSAYKAGK